MIDTHTKIPSTKSQIPNNSQVDKQQTTSKVYDLESRTFLFAKNTSLICKELPKTTSNNIYINQIVRSSSSIGANYIEANEALSKKDFVMRIKICRKEAKESTYWLRLLMETNNDNTKNLIIPLLKEAMELKKILSAILLKC
jgi:four helix bundle protein